MKGARLTYGTGFIVIFELAPKFDLILTLLIFSACSDSSLVVVYPLLFPNPIMTWENGWIDIKFQE